MREFTDEEGRSWHAVALDAVVAHAKPGAVLAFAPADQPGAEPIRSSVTFNSQKAADFALGTMSVKELRRRLSLGRAMV